MERPSGVAFGNERLKAAYEKLERGKFEDRELHEWIGRAIEDLKRNPVWGIRIPAKLIPRGYARKFNVSNLWKYNLPGAWHLLYSVAGNSVEVVAVILEWLTHKEYDRRFGYT